MKLSEQIRAFVVDHYLTGSPLGHRLLKAAEDIETLEKGDWPNPQLQRE